MSRDLAAPTGRKAEIREAIKTMEHAAPHLEKTYGDALDMRPWATHDHPISVAHWILVQCRIDLKGLLARTKDEINPSPTPPG